MPTLTPSPQLTTQQYLDVVNDAIGKHFIATAPAEHKGYIFYFTTLKQSQTSEHFIGQVVAYDVMSGKHIFTPVPGNEKSITRYFNSGEAIQVEPSDGLSPFECEVGEKMSETIEKLKRSLDAAVDRIISFIDIESSDE